MSSERGLGQANRPSGQVEESAQSCSLIRPFVYVAAIILRWAGAEENVANETAGSFQPFAASAPLVVITVVSAATFRSLRIGPFPKLGALGVEEWRR
jgi:hypothetical protein